MIAHTLTIPNWLPPRLNQVRGRHWYAEAKLKKEAIAFIVFYARLCGVPPARGRRRVSLRIVLGPRRRQPDRDAYDKMLLDALCRAGLLLDDSDRGLVGRVDIQFRRGPNCETTITIEEAEAETPLPSAEKSLTDR